MSLQTDVPVSEANGQNTPYPPIMLVESYRSWRGLNFGTMFYLVSILLSQYIISPDHMYKSLLSYPFQSSHLQLSTAHWVTPELSE